MLRALRIASSQVMQDSQSYPSFVEKLNIRTSKFSAIIRACWGVLLFTLMAVMATPSAQMVSPPSGLTITHVRDTVTGDRTLTWTLASNGGEAVTYRLQRTQANSGDGAASATPTQLVELENDSALSGTYIDTEAPSGSRRHYIYGIRATNSAGAVVAGLRTTGVVSGVTSEPQNLMLGEVTATTVALDWEPPASDGNAGGGFILQGYLIERAQGANAFMALPQITASTTIMHIDTTAMGATAYRYRVRSTNPVGESAPSNIVTATTPAGVPATPTNLTAGATDTIITLNWGTPANGGSEITSYQIERSEGGGAFAPITPDPALAGDATSYTDIGLSPVTQYSYRVSAINTIGTGDFAAVSLTTLVEGVSAAPTSLLAMAGSDALVINLQWTAPTDTGDSAITGYQIERSQGDGSGTFDIVAANHANTSYTDMDGNLLASTQYSYRVFAINDQGTGATSEIASATTAALVVAPSGLTIMHTRAGNTITLTWMLDSNGGEAVTYRLQRSRERSGNDRVITDDMILLPAADNSVTMYVDTNTVSTRNYIYGIMASNSAGSVAAATQTRGDFSLATVSSAPLNLMLDGVTATTVSLVWDEPTNDGVSGRSNALLAYQIERAEGLSEGAFMAFPLHTDTETAAYTDTTALAETTYRYRVRATNPVGDSAASNIITATTPAEGAAAAPTGLMAVASDSTIEINLSWQAPADTGDSAITGYRIERSQGDGSGTFDIVEANHASTSYTDMDSSLLANTQYSYRVTAINDQGTGIASEIASATVSFPPAAPTGLMAVASASTIEISLSWQAPADIGSSAITGYQIERSQGDGSGTFDIVEASHPSASYTDTDSSLLGNTQYSYRVFAINDGGTGVASEIASATTVAAVAPSGLTITHTRTGNTITLIWALTSDGGQAVTYRLQRVREGTGGSNVVTDNMILLAAADNSVTMYEDTGTSSSNNYIYGIMASNSAGSVAAATQTRGGADPATVSSAPLDLMLDGVTATTVSLVWDEPADDGFATSANALLGYRIERAEGLAGGAFMAFPLHTDTETAAYTDTTALAETTYRYRVRANNPVGDSAASNIITATTPAEGAAAAPTGLMAVASNSTIEISLSWQAPADTGDSAITGYRIERSQGDGSGTFDIVVASHPSTSYTDMDSSLLINTQYSYRVFAINDQGTGIASEIASATVSLPPAAPTGLMAVASDSTIEISLSWQAPADIGSTAITGYQIERSQGDGSGTFDIVEASHASTSYTDMDSSLLVNTQYSYRVSAINDRGTGVASDIESATTAAVLAPSGLTITHTRTGNTITLTWALTSDGGEAVTYRLQRSQETAGSDRLIRENTILLPAADDSVTMYEDTNTVSTRNYIYGIMASNSAGAVAAATQTRGDFSLATVPSAPLNLMLDGVTATTVSLVWEEPTNDGVSGRANALLAYQIERAEGLAEGAFMAFPLHTDTETAAYTDTTALAGTTYRYRVRANNPVGDSAPSNIITATTLVEGVPAAPTGLMAVASDSTIEISLSWQAPADTGDSAITGYQIERSQGDGSGTFDIVVASHASTSYTDMDSSLLINTQYSYRVFAINDQGTGVASGIASAMVSFPPAAPTGLMAVASASTIEISLSWQAPADIGSSAITGYQIERSQGDGSGTFDIVEASHPSASYTDMDSSLLGNTQYSYRVSAINDGGTGVASEIASATTPAAVAPSGLTIMHTRTGNTITLTWVLTNDGGEAVTYRLQRSREGSQRGIEENIILLPAADDSVTMHVDTGTSSSNNYIYGIMASNSAGFVTAATQTRGVADLATVSSAPLNLMLDAVTATTVSLVWDAPTNDGVPGSPNALLAYRIERAEGASAFMALPLHTDTETAAYMDTTVVAATTYRYRVRANNPVGDSAASNVITATTDAAEGVAAAPTGLMAVASDSIIEISLSWQAPADTGGSAITGYQIERSQGDGSGTFDIVVASHASTSYTDMDSSLLANTQYSYRVSAINDRGRGVASEIASATTLSALPAAPTGLMAVASDSTIEISLSWQAPADTGGSAITGYQIERSQGDGSGTFDIVVASHASTSYTDTDSNLLANIQYSYRVSAINDQGTSVASEIASATTLSAPPAAPTGLMAVASDSTIEISLSWQAPADIGSSAITGYRIERSQGDGSGTFDTVVASHADTSYTDTDSNLLANTQYSYRVSAINDGGTGVASEIVSATTLPVPPAAPTGLSAVADDTDIEISLSWQAPADTGGSAITGYRIERSQGDGSGTFDTVVASHASTSYTDTDSNLLANTQYSYRVSAINDRGTGVASEIASATTLSLPPAAPTGLTAVAPDSTIEISLSWQVPADIGSTAIIGYQIERSQGDGSGTFDIVVASHPSTSYTDTDSNLLANTQYSYRVSAINDGGTGVASEIISATTGIVAPSGLSLTAIQNSATEVSLSWELASNGGEAVTYSLERSEFEDLSAATTLTLNPNTLTEFTDSGLVAGTQYYYRVTATNSEGFAMSAIETPTGGLSERAQALNESLLPSVVQATAAINLSAISNRIDALLSGAVGNKSTFAGADSSHAIIKQLGSDLSSEQELGDMLVKWLGNSSFSHSLAGSELAGNANISVWGSGDYKDLEDDSGALNWDGNVWGLSVGADVQLDADWLLGFALSWSSGEFDYTDGETTSAGDYDYENFGIHPYWNWAPSGQDYNIWGSASYGSGEIEIRDQAMLGAVSSDTSQYGVAAGINLTLSSSHSQQASHSIDLKSDVSALWVDIDGSGEDILSDTIQHQRARLLLSSEHDYLIGAQRHLIPSIEFGGRYDTGGGAEDGTGIELAASLSYKDLLAGFMLSGRMNTLLGADYDEWGASALLRFGGGASSRGLSFSLEPTIGRASSDPSRLWQQGLSDLSNSSSSLSGSLVSEIAYGMGMHSAFSVPATWQPYANMELGSAIRRYRLGLRYQFVQGLGFRIEGQSLRNSGASTTDSNTGKDYGVQLKTEFEF